VSQEYKHKTSPTHSGGNVEASILLMSQEYKHQTSLIHSGGKVEAITISYY